MKLAVASEHRDFFNKNGYIELAELLPPDQLHKLDEGIKQALVNRLKLPSHAMLEKLPAETIFKAGRDLWRNSTPVKKIMLSPSFAELAWEFCQQRPLRVGYTQFLPAEIRSTFPPTQPLMNQSSLAEISSIQGLACGLILCLQGDQEAAVPSPLPIAAGHGSFFAPGHQIDFAGLDRRCSYMIIAYATQKSVYILNENDPLGFVFRESGYALGDALSDKLNPIVLR